MGSEDNCPRCGKRPDAPANPGEQRCDMCGGGGQRFADAVADPMCAPFGWQTQAPDNLFTRGDPVSDSADFRRVMALPRRPPLDPNSVTAEAMVELAMQKYGRHNPACRCKEIDPRRPCITKVHAGQAWVLREIELYQGLLASLPVGWGKTICNILGALAFTDVHDVLCLVPASLTGQIQIDYQLLAQHFRVPGIQVHAPRRKGESRPLHEVIPGLPTLHVYPYSRLSLPNSSAAIIAMSPDAIIADEVDAVRNMTSSRAMRVFNYVSGRDAQTDQERQRRQRTKFVGWTGSLTDSSIKEMYHLSLLALRERSPLPLDPVVAEEWSQCLDASTNQSPPGKLIEFCEPGEDVRRGYGRRLAETPGFIVVGENKVMVRDRETGLDTGREVQISIRPKHVAEIPQIIAEALAMVRKGTRPDTLAPDGESLDDEELEDMLAVARCAQEVSTGVLYRWRFPRNEPEWLRKDWLRKRKAWNREVRTQSMEGITYLDSAFLCEEAAKRAWGQLEELPDRPSWKAPSWPAWLEIRDEVKPVTEAVRLHPFVVEDAVRWGRERPGVIWYSISELARWIGELSGWSIHDGGPGAEDRLRRETGDQTIICSIRSNARGRDGIQFAFARQLILNPPASATMMTQLHGRTVRRGQHIDEVTSEIYVHTPELRKAVVQAIRRSEYVRDLIGAEQLLLRGWNED